MISCDGLSSHRSENTVDRATIITLTLESLLHIYNHLVWRQAIVTVDRAVVRVVIARIVAPGRVPISRVPVVGRAEVKRDPWVVAPIPTAIVV